MSLRIAPLRERWLLRVLCAAFSAIKKLRSPVGQDIFCLIKTNEHDHFTRSKTSIGVVPQWADRMLADRSFGTRAALLRNFLPPCCRNARSISDYRKYLSELSASVVLKFSDFAFCPLAV